MSFLKKIRNAIIENVLVESKTTDEVQQIRLNTCSNCPHAVLNEFKKIDEDSTCGVCGCYLIIKSLAAANVEKVLGGLAVLPTICPLGLWAYYDDEEENIIDNDFKLANIVRAKKGQPLLLEKGVLPKTF